MRTSGISGTAATTGFPARRPPMRGGRAAALGRILAIARRHGYVLLRSPHRFFDITVWPVVDTLLFGSMAVFFSSRGGPAGAAQTGAAYLLVGIVLWHVVYQSQIAVSTGFLEETWSRNVLSLMVTPLREWEYVAGVALFGMVKLVLGVGSVILLALAAYSLDLGVLGFSLIPIAVLLLMLGWVVALFVIGLGLRYGSGAEALAWGILFVVQPMSGVFYPVDALPGVLQPIAQLLPTTHAFAAARELIDGRPTPWGQLGIAAAGTAVAAAVAIAFVTRMLGIFRSRGYVTRYS